MLQSEDFKNLLGVSVDEAKNKIPPRYTICIIEENGQSFYRSAEFNPYRICVIVKNGIIFKIDGVF